MKVIVYILVLFISLFNLGCNKEKDETQPPVVYSDNIEGTWVWVEFTGGLAGWTKTPATEGYDEFMIFTSDSVCRYTTDSFGHVDTNIFWNKYVLTKMYDSQKNDSVDGIKIENSFRSYVNIYKDTLSFSTPSGISDGGVTLYKRK